MKTKKESGQYIPCAVKIDRKKQLKVNAKKENRSLSNYINNAINFYVDFIAPKEVIKIWEKNTQQ